MQKLSPRIRELSRKLERQLEGSVAYKDGDRALFSTDASNYRQVPLLVCFPKSIADLENIFYEAKKAELPITARGGGTALAGQTCNEAIVIDYSRYMNRILHIDPQTKTAEVEPGCVLDDLKKKTKDFGLVFGPDPATHDRCTIGGMLGNNSCGVHSVYSGRTVDNVSELNVITYDADKFKLRALSENEFAEKSAGHGPEANIFQKIREIREPHIDLLKNAFPRIPRRVSGYNLDELVRDDGFVHMARAIVGSESTLVHITRAKLHLVQAYEKTFLAVASFKDVSEAAGIVPNVLELNPIGLEGLDETLVHLACEKHLHLDAIGKLPSGSAWIFVEFPLPEEAFAQHRLKKDFEDLVRSKAALGVQFFSDPDEQSKMWEVRESGLGATARSKETGEAWEGWEDSAVPPERLAEYLARLRELFKKYDYKSALYGHFGDGCIHCRINFDFYSKEGLDHYYRFVHEASDLVLSLGGSLSGEHGDGQSRGELLSKMYGPKVVKLFEDFKSAWDPSWKMNPGKVVKPYGILDHLRINPSTPWWKPETHFKYPEDEGLLATASRRCVGVGKCRKTQGGVMCPSYMVTKEEKHSTRGRARLLFELMTHGLSEAWQNEDMKEALDLCLACKACKTECPVNVDMASYKAEFLSHYYEKKLRPRAAYSMGWIFRWAPMGSRFSRLTNALSSWAWTAWLMKKIAGISPHRELPLFSEQNFRDLWQSRAPLFGEKNKKVMLWPDTFNNYFESEHLLAAAESLEILGYQVLIPSKRLCCGRPLYDFGFLDLAKQKLKEVMEWSKTVDYPIVGLEPSCMAVFKDELVNFFPGDPIAKRLSERALTWNEFVTREGINLPTAGLDKKVLLHVHCHERALQGHDQALNHLNAIGYQTEFIDSGCCGMAGAFGFEEAHYSVSKDCAERVLLPRLRKRSSNEIFVADGFSCRSQVSDLLGLEASHSSLLLRERLMELDFHKSKRQAV